VDFDEEAAKVGKHWKVGCGPDCLCCERNARIATALTQTDALGYARGLREAARMGREDEIMVTITPESTRTQRAWGIAVVEALCQMLDAKARALAEANKRIAELSDLTPYIRQIQAAESSLRQAQERVERLAKVHVPPDHDHESDTPNPDGDCWVCRIQDTPSSAQGQGREEKR
jgi:hypothetical protein